MPSSESISSGVMCSASRSRRLWEAAGTGGPPTRLTVGGRARLLWDDTSLYVGFDVFDRTLRGGFPADAVDPHLWERDTVELMIDPDGDGDNRDYYEILKAIGQGGRHPIDAEVALMKKWIETYHFPMEIIREVEPFARGVYCGAVGWMSPDGEADFSVAIRTLSVTGQDIVMNVGGGLTHGSTVEGEWEEALWKARFVKAAVSRD